MLCIICHPNGFPLWEANRELGSWRNLSASPYAMKTRRDFLKAGFAVGAGFSLLDLGGIFAAESATSRATPAARAVLVAVRDGDRATMLDRALAELGGIQKFVRPGQTVLIKPNIGWDVPPERAANTHPEVIARLVAHCRDAGAKSVTIFDNSCDQWERAYANSGIEKAARDAGALVVNGKDESLYRETPIPGGVKLRSVRVHALVLESDVFFNVPVLKHHSGTLMTAAMKNLMGVIWDRGFYHRTDLHQCIADFLTLRQPTLNLVDAYHPMVRNGPRGRTVEDVIEMRTLLASTDIVAVDAAAAKLLGHQPADIPHVKLAAAMKLGRMDLENLDIRRLKLT